MANKKVKLKKAIPEKTMMKKIGDKAAHLKEELIEGKNHLIELAGDAITSVKSTIQELTTKQKLPAKKVIKKKAEKIVASSRKYLPKKKIENVAVHKKKSAVKKAAAK
jgi:hypothetical protein